MNKLASFIGSFHLSSHFSTNLYEFIIYLTDTDTKTKLQFDLLFTKFFKTYRIQYMIYKTLAYYKYGKNIIYIYKA